MTQMKIDEWLKKLGDDEMLSEEAISNLHDLDCHLVKDLIETQPTIEDLERFGFSYPTSTKLLKEISHLTTGTFS